MLSVTEWPWSSAGSLIESSRLILALTTTSLKKLYLTCFLFLTLFSCIPTLSHPLTPKLHCQVPFRSRSLLRTNACIVLMCSTVATHTRAAKVYASTCAVRMCAVHPCIACINNLHICCTESSIYATCVVQLKIFVRANFPCSSNTV